MSAMQAMTMNVVMVKLCQQPASARRAIAERRVMGLNGDAILNCHAIPLGCDIRERAQRVDPVCRTNGSSIVSSGPEGWVQNPETGENPINQLGCFGRICGEVCHRPSNIGCVTIRHRPRCQGCRPPRRDRILCGKRWQAHLYHDPQLGRQHYGAPPLCGHC